MTFKNISAAVILTFATGLTANASGMLFTGSEKEVICITPDRSTGLDMVYVVYDMAQVSSVRIKVSGQVSISKYSNLGGGYAQPVNFRIDGAEAVIESPEGDLGYIVESPEGSQYFWIVNYQSHQMSLRGVSAASSQDCDNTVIDIDGDAAPIYYYSIDGRRCELDRDIDVAYNNLEWSDEEENFVQVEMHKTASHISGSLTIAPPLYCSSTFTVSGDRFLVQWGIGKTVVSAAVSPNGLSCYTYAEQTNLPDEGEDAEASNVIKTEVSGFGGSAPVDVSFKAFVTDAVIHNEWQIASDEQFEYIDYRFNEQNLDYSFTDEGTFYIRYIGSNSDGSCETIGDTYTVGVGSSELKIPNAFTPNGDGINDVWKVAYRSLLKFECSIFDRYGNLLYHFTDPSKGWDGKYKGKVVKPGVYFYVIEATGSDGKKYKKGGDINIIKSNKYGESSTGEQTPES